jgi:cobalamin-dependent methionine synthase I
MMGTVRGDLHDIGKNLVCMMAEGAGFEVHDIGVDQSVQKFMDAADKCNPDIIGMSALLTTTMNYMKTVIDGFEEAGRTGVKFAIGGAPISEMFSEEIGADGYGQDASSAVDLFLHLMGAGDAPTSAPQATGTEEPAVDAPKAEQATYQVLYWKDIPSAVKAWDENGEAKIELAPRFAERIDLEAQKLGLTDEDSYVAQYHWSDEVERAGSAEEVVAAVRDELEAASP